MVQTMVFTYSLSSVSSNKYEFYRGAATSGGAVNGGALVRRSSRPLTGDRGCDLSVFQYPIMLISANAQKSVTNIDGTPCNISLLRISFDSGK